MFGYTETIIGFELVNFVSDKIVKSNFQNISTNVTIASSIAEIDWKQYMRDVTPGLPYLSQTKFQLVILAPPTLGTFFTNNQGVHFPGAVGCLSTTTSHEKRNPTLFLKNAPNIGGACLTRYWTLVYDENRSLSET